MGVCWNDDDNEVNIRHCYLHFGGDLINPGKSFWRRSIEFYSAASYDGVKILLKGFELEDSDLVSGER